MTLDLINGLFESFGGVFVALSILQILKDKDVKGVSIIGVSFFTAWGAWNLIYYPSLGQWWSLAGAGATFGANLIWVGLMVYYSRRNRDKISSEA